MRSIPEVTEAARQVRLETLARLRVKVVQIDRHRPAVRAFSGSRLISIDEVLALIDEEMRDA